MQVTTLHILGKESEGFGGMTALWSAIDQVVYNRSEPTKADGGTKI